MERYKSLILLVCVAVLLSVGSSCKETPQKRRERKPQYDIEKVSKRIESFTQTEDVPPPVGLTEDKNHPVVDLMEALGENVVQGTSEQGLQKGIPRFALSQFVSEAAGQIIRVNITLRGVPHGKHDEVEEHLWGVLNAHTPQPWELRRSRTIEKNESVWGQLNIDYKQQTLRLRRASKTAAARAQVRYTLEMTMAVPGDLKASWDNWSYTYEDEIVAANERAASTLFWQRIEQNLPTLTVADETLTAQWLRTQGLSPQVLGEGLSAVQLPEHRYYSDGCLVTGSVSQGFDLRKFDYSLPQHIDVANILDIYCTRDATFILASETPVRVALYYQPTHKPHAWKTLLTFNDNVQVGDIALHVDDDLICLYTGLDAQHNRGMEIKCLERSSGMVRWETTRLSGALRGIAFGADKIVAINDQAAVVLSRSGRILQAVRLAMNSRMRGRPFCVLDNRLMFMTGPGQFASWNLDNNEIDWQGAVFESEFMHCGLQNTFLFTEVGGYLLAYDVEAQTPLWKYRTVTVPQDAFSYHDYIYLLLDRAVLVLDRKTGVRKAQVPLPWPVEHFISIGHKLYLDAHDAIYTWR